MSAYQTILRPRMLALSGYVAYLIGGLIFLGWPVSLIKEETSPGVVIVWHVFLIAGSLICIYGVLKRKVQIEATGIPLIGAALTAYSALLAFANADPSRAGARIGFAFVLTAAAIGLAGRMTELIKVIRIALTVERRGEPNDRS